MSSIPSKKLTDDNLDQLSKLFAEEFKVVYEFSRERNDRKAQIFKLSIALFSIFVTAVFSLFTLYARVPEIKIQEIEGLQPVILTILFTVGVINTVLIWQYVEAHIGTIFSAQHANLLRRSQSSIVYYHIEGEFPKSDYALKDPSTNYWRFFGSSRAGEIDNSGLIMREQNLLKTSGGITMLLMLGMSFSALLVPFLYYIFDTNISNAKMIFVTGAIAIITLFGGGYLLINSHSRMINGLKKHEENRKIP